MRKKGSAKNTPGPPRGGFTLRGSWDENGRPDSPLTEFVRGMRGERKATTMTPAEFSERIPAPFLSAFPNHEFWASCHSWFSVRCGTSAESTVAYAFVVRGNPALEPEGEEVVCEADDVAAIVRSLISHFSPKPVPPQQPEPRRLVAPPAV